MITTTLLISEEAVRNFTDINTAVDSALIRNNIRVAGDYWLRNTLGELLYRRIIDDVDNNTLSGNYQTLLVDYCQDFLLYAAYYETLESIYIRPRNNGLVKPTGGENSIEADMALYNQKRQSVKNKMDFYNQRLTEYLIEEEALFPELNASNKLYDNPPDYTNKHKNPFVTRKTGLAEEFSKRGYRIYDSRYKQYPQ
jgi:hypothetical protein